MPLKDAMDYLTWTYFFRRLVVNPTYYGLDAERPAKGDALDQTVVDEFLSRVVEDALAELEESQCIAIDEGGVVEAMVPGRIASYYYLSHLTMRTFTADLDEAMSVGQVLEVRLHRVLPLCGWKWCCVRTHVRCVWRCELDHPQRQW
jgi:replicative superfamily II helicase